MNKNTLNIIVACLILSSAVFAQDGAIPKDVKTSDFVYPVVEDGRKQMLIRGSSLESFGNYVILKGARINLYAYEKDKEDAPPTLSAETYIFAPKATFNSSKKSASSSERFNARIFPKAPADKEVKIHQTVIDGIGFGITQTKGDDGAPSHDMVIHSNVRVVIYPQPNTTDEARTEFIEITSKRLHFNQADRQLVFLDDVCGKQTTGGVNTYTLTTDKLTLHLATKGSIREMDAEGNVCLKTTDGTATAEKGNMDADQNFTFSGSPELKSAKGHLSGTEKVFYSRTADGSNIFSTSGGKGKLDIPREGDGTLLLPELTKGTGKDEK